jgi:hydroxymethylpyrimidine pyrophosphatase-like HAD family hydrolase
MTVIRRTVRSFKELADSIPPEVSLIFIDIDDTITSRNHNWSVLAKPKYTTKLVDIFNKARHDCKNDKKFNPSIKLEQVIYLGKHYRSLFVERETPQIIRALSKEKVICILTSGYPCARKPNPLKQNGIFNPIVFAFTHNKGQCIENIVKFLQKCKIQVGAAALVDNHQHKLQTFANAFKNQLEFKKYLILYDNPVAPRLPNENEFYHFWYRVCVDALKNGSYHHWVKRQTEYKQNYKGQYRQNINVLRRKMKQLQQYNEEY